MKLLDDGVKNYEKKSYYTFEVARWYSEHLLSLADFLPMKVGFF